MKLTPFSLARVLPVYKQIFPSSTLHSLWSQAQPHAYPYSLHMTRLPAVLLCAFLKRTPSLEKMLEDWGTHLATGCKSSLSYALRRPALLRFLQLILQTLASHWKPRAGELVALDSMAVTLGNRRPCDAPKFNNKTVGGGVLWALWLDAPRGSNPVRLLTVAKGAWNDSRLLRSAEPLRPGPLYLMDRGFFCFELLEMWLKDGVHFIVRAKKGNVSCRQTLEAKGQARRAGRVEIAEDAVVLLGRTAGLRVRLVWAKLPGGEDLILVSDRMEWSAERLLEAYKRRWDVERFHNVLKETIGLAHLYSFQQAGMETLTRTAFLLAILVWMEGKGQGRHEDLVKALRQLLRGIRRLFDRETPWKRNITVRFRKRRSGGGKSTAQAMAA